ncbi:hypothetical protein SLS62_009337 [Diatrype stigma]|uniref:Capsule polysaccharide biosynthesis protein n=1 Tax=Diatrype stigma TaxID=117547 RepID=A0AAN9YJN5_9PEZI
MESFHYPLPAGVHEIPAPQLDLRPDAEIDHDLLHPAPVSVASEKNIWLFWHSGYAGMHPYTRRNVRAWHRRFARQGWVVRVVDRVPGSPLHAGAFLDLTSDRDVPRAFADGTIAGAYAPQHASDLVRFPLLLRHGGVYADAGLLPIGDLDRLWRATVAAAKPPSPSRFELLAYDCSSGGGAEPPVLANYFLAARRGNPMLARAHRLLLALWEGRQTTEGMHASPLLAGVPLQGRRFGDAVSRELTDYIIQGQAMSLVLGLVDEEGWDGPRYAAEHVYAMDYMEGSQLINEITAWDGNKAFRLMSLPLPKEGEPESADQRQAREIVEACLQRSFGFKLAHGMILKILGETLGSLWRSHEGSDDVPGTYAHWLRYAIVHWVPDRVPPALEFQVFEPFKQGPLLRDI